MNYSESFIAFLNIMWWMLADYKRYEAFLYFVDTGYSVDGAYKLIKNNW